MDAAGSDHWDSTYAAGDTQRSWYQPHASGSMDLLLRSGVPRDSAIVDVGGGAGTLVDDLLAEGFSDITVLDISADGLGIAARRLGSRGADVTWLVADLLQWRPTRAYGAWHDRAVLHFLTDAEDQARYADRLAAATRPGAAVVIGVFGEAGPTSCSGLDVVRYSAASLTGLLSGLVSVEEECVVEHRTPTGAIQPFQWIRGVRI